MNERLLNVDQVAERLGMSRRTILRRRHGGLIPGCTRIGPGYDGLRWSESEIDDFIDRKLAQRPTP